MTKTIKIKLPKKDQERKMQSISKEKGNKVILNFVNKTVLTKFNQHIIGKNISNNNNKPQQQQDRPPTSV